MRRAVAVPNRTTALLLPALIALALAPCASARPDTADASLRFSFVPQRAFQGQPASVSVAVRPSGVRCAASFRYADGATQSDLAPVRAVRGRATWRWRVAEKAPTGPAKVTVSCKGVGRITRSVSVVGASEVAAKVAVSQRGWSQRNNKFGPGSNVSWGLALTNPSPDKDAFDVNVLVNFVDATNTVLQTATVRIPAVAAASDYFLGGASPLSSTAPVVRLEVVVRVGSQAPQTTRRPPTADLRIYGSVFDPGFVGGVEGQLLNDHASLLLSSARLSVVVFDAAGNIVGGGSGFTMAALAPGVRVYFNAVSGFTAIPLDRAAAVQVSVDPSYRSAS